MKRIVYICSVLALGLCIKGDLKAISDSEIDNLTTATGTKFVLEEQLGRLLNAGATQEEVNKERKWFNENVIWFVGGRADNKTLKGYLKPGLKRINRRIAELNARNNERLTSNQPGINDDNLAGTRSGGETFFIP